MSELKDVSTVIVMDEDRYLILKRSFKSRGGGLWNFPGGSVEEGESFDEAGARELKEEADLDVKVEDLTVLGELTTSRLKIQFFITNEFSGEVKINNESVESRWVTLDEARDLYFVSGKGLPPELESVILEYRESLRSEAGEG